MFIHDIENWIWDRYAEMWAYRQHPGTPVYQSLILMAGAAAIPLVIFQNTVQLVRWRIRHQWAWAAHYPIGEIYQHAGRIGASAADDAFSLAMHGKTMRQMIPRMARIGSRVIPGIGWAMFAYDAYDYYKTGRVWGVPVDKYLGIREHKGRDPKRKN